MRILHLEDKWPICDGLEVDGDYGMGWRNNDLGWKMMKIGQKIDEARRGQIPGALEFVCSRSTWPSRMLTGNTTDFE